MIRFIRIAERDYNLTRICSVDIEDNGFGTLCTVEYDGVDGVHSMSIPIKGTVQENRDRFENSLRFFSRWPDSAFVDTGMERR